jgi:hypothetical protein
MNEQNFKNHIRLVPLYHYVASTAIVIPFVLSVIHFIQTLGAASGRLAAAGNLLLIFAVGLIYWFTRAFALKAQDRAIRAEESLRYFSITGKLLDPQLRMSQIIALRFAPDNEFIHLAKRAVDENLSQKGIKLAIQNWKADNHRV